MLLNNSNNTFESLNCIMKNKSPQLVLKSNIQRSISLSIIDLSVFSYHQS